MLGLILGGGAAKGYAHIGVLKYLTELNIKPELIVGASMGALIGGFYSAGFTPEQIEDIALQVDNTRKKWLFPLQISTRGLVNDQHIISYLKPYFGSKRIEKLPIRFAAIATDIEKHCEIIINRGNLLKAVRAAISIPGIFEPYHLAGHTLVDGGFVNPVPIKAALKLGATKIIAVNVLKDFGYKQQLIKQKKSSNQQYSIMYVLTRIIEYTTTQLIKQQAQNLQNDILINVNTRGIGLNDFEKAKPAIKMGYHAAKKHKDQLIKLFDK